MPKRDIEKERQRILSAVSSFSSENVNARVALVLNNFPQTRDSDIGLQIKYWELFQPELLNGRSITLEDYSKITRLPTIARARAFIQNTCGLFRASPEVREQRGKLEEEEKEKLKKGKPDYPAMTIFADESGKNERTLIVGSVWFLDALTANELINEIFAWRHESSIKGEFHFTNINDGNIRHYKHLVNLLNAKSSAIGLKVITVERSGISNVQDAFIRLYAHLLLKGIENEESSGRAKLPRYIQFMKDKEEEGYDKLMLSEIESRLKTASESHFQNKLYIDFLRAEKSEDHPFLQVADLFASSINRIYNQPGTTNTAKDEIRPLFS